MGIILLLDSHYLYRGVSSATEITLQEQLLNDTLHTARNHFRNKPIRVWYVKLDNGAWRAFIINTSNKIKLAEGPIRKTARGSVTALRSQMANAIQKTV